MSNGDDFSGFAPGAQGDRAASKLIRLFNQAAGIAREADLCDVEAFAHRAAIRCPASTKIDTALVVHHMSEVLAWMPDEFRHDGDVTAGVWLETADDLDVISERAAEFAVVARDMGGRAPVRV